jgi:hypothetical protein
MRAFETNGGCAFPRRVPVVSNRRSASAQPCPVLWGAAISPRFARRLRSPLTPGPRTRRGFARQGWHDHSSFANASGPRRHPTTQVPREKRMRRVRFPASILFSRSSFPSPSRKAASSRHCRRSLVFFQGRTPLRRRSGAGRGASNAGRRPAAHASPCRTGGREGEGPGRAPPPHRILRAEGPGLRCTTAGAPPLPASQENRKAFASHARTLKDQTQLRRGCIVWERGRSSCERSSDDNS